MSAHKRALLTPDSAALRRLDELAAQMRQKSQMNLRGSPAEQRAAARHEGDTGRAQGLLSHPPVTLEVAAPMSLEMQLEDKECDLIVARCKLLDERDKVAALEAQLQDAASWARVVIKRLAVAEQTITVLRDELADLKAENESLRERLEPVGILLVDEAPDYNEMLNCRCSLEGADELVLVGDALLANWRPA